MKLPNDPDPKVEDAKPFANLSIERAVSLRWALRDIKAKRFVLLPVSEADLQVLTELGLVEIRGDAPVLTTAGLNALDSG